MLLFFIVIIVFVVVVVFVVIVVIVLVDTFDIVVFVVIGPRNLALKFSQNAIYFKTEFAGMKSKVGLLN